jgi:hypothetical protein
MTGSDSPTHSLDVSAGLQKIQLTAAFGSGTACAVAEMGHAALSPFLRVSLKTSHEFVSFALALCMHFFVCVRFYTNH